MAKKDLVSINDEEFNDRIILNKTDALVKFSPHWNAAGHILSNLLNGLSKQYNSKIRFYSLDIKPDSSLCSTYRIGGTPTILFFKKGKLVDRLSGLVQKEIISEKLDQLINVTTH